MPEPASEKATLAGRRGRDEDRPRPDRIGPYHLLEKLGEGGMGEVYEAEQQRPLRRRVALKLIKPGMDSRQILARFEGERQALALMNHPSVAHIFDAGTTEAGRPYFVMECVRGVPVTQYCDTERLDLRRRIELFIQICDGVQHAHQKGLIHRDLKPSNVLVVLQDGRAVPKIIDFGVAKAIAHRLTEETLHTELGQLIGTPAYMSPEQAEMTGLDIDTRTDVYTLGAMLYELLTGMPPFHPKELRECGLDELRRRIREVEPPRPSGRVAGLGEAAVEIAARRDADPLTLVRQLRGDLDWIVMKAMEKDRTRRYSSVAELAVDLRHHLEHRPVMAGPPSVTYRLEKFFLRHRTGVMASALLLLALLLGTAGTSIGLLRAVRAEHAARQGLLAAEEISDFLIELFEVSRPTDGTEITVREILDQGAERIHHELGEQPLVKARLLATMGVAYRQLGLYRQAEAQLRESLALRENLLQEEPLEVADSLKKLGWLLTESGDYAEARGLLERALRIEESSELADPVDLASTQSRLAILYGRLGDEEEARDWHRRALALRERELGPDHLAVGKSLNALGSSLSRSRRFEEARPLFERALAIHRQALGTDHIDLVDMLNNLANLHRELGDRERALEYYDEALAISERALGPDHPDLGISANNLGELLAEMGRTDEAEQHFLRCLEIWQRSLPEDHPFLPYPLGGLARLYTDRGDYDRAEPLFERALAILDDKAPDHALLPELLADYAALLRVSGRPEEAERVERRLIAFKT